MVGKVRVVCGRFAAARSATAYAYRLALQHLTTEAHTLPANWNVAPTNPLLVVAAAGDDLLMEVGRWGLLSPWSKSNTGLINARAETVATKPAFSSAFHKRRCIVPADGYYEWQKTATGKQPWFITAEASQVDSFGDVDQMGSGNDGEPMLFFAGIYNDWTPSGFGSGSSSEVTSAFEPLSALKSVSLLTTTATPQLDFSHHRMPVSLPPEQCETWILGNQAEAEALLAEPQSEFAFYRVSSQVNSVRNNGPDLVAKLSEKPTETEEPTLTLF
jgi:putative SOS response-associated peptidase YedK